MVQTTLETKETEAEYEDEQRMGSNFSQFFDIFLEACWGEGMGEGEGEAIAPMLK